MPVCKFCKDRDDTPDGATRIRKGQTCGRCGMSYVEERAELSDGPSLSDFE